MVRALAAPPPPGRGSGRPGHDRPGPRHRRHRPQGLTACGPDDRDLTDAHHGLRKPALLAGISRVYQPKDEEGEQLPPESTRVRVKADEVIRRTAAIMTRLFDVTATKDWVNCSAKADVVVDGRTILRDVPISYLLFLEKQLTDLHTFAKKLPVLDAAEAWSFDESADCWKPGCRFEPGMPLHVRR